MIKFFKGLIGAIQYSFCKECSAELAYSIWLIPFSFIALVISLIALYDAYYPTYYPTDIVVYLIK